MKTLFSLRWFDGEGTAPADGANAAAENAGDGVGTREDPRNILYGKQPDTAEQAPEEPETEPEEDRSTRYKNFKKEFKKEYQDDLQRVINKRFKNTKQVESERDTLIEQNQKYGNLMEALAQRFGTDDIEQITRQLTEDKAWREEQALQAGLTLEAYDKVQAAEQKASKATSELEKMQEQSVIEGWQEEAAELVKLYPEFVFEDEVENSEKFGFALVSGMSMRDAYQFAHFDEILSGAIQYTAQTVKENLAASRAKRAARPAENGTHAGPAAVVKNDVSKLTKADIEEINRRVLRGEKISF